MLKKFTSLLFLTFFLFGTKNSSTAQTPQHFIQTLSGANSFPLNSTTSNRSQFLILASELSGVLQAGAISKIYITPSSSVASSTFTNFTVKIGMTTLTDLGTGTQPYITGVTTALSAPSITFTGSVANQWLEIPLDNPILYDGTSNLIIELSQTAYTSGLSLRINTGILGRRLYGSVSGTTGTANSGRLDFGMDLNPIGPNNAGLTTLTSPISFCPGTHPIKVKVKNSGINIIDSVKVAWSLDGVAQPTYSLNLPLDTMNGTGLIEREVTLGSHTFTTAPVAFKAWTFLPNNVPDTFNLNDTLSQTLQSSLSGTYTINSALPTGGTNYQTFAAFTSDLNSYGVCGPVIANVSGGPFVEKVDFGNIGGTSAANYIRVNGNGATVQFTNTITDRQLLTLNGTKYLTIDSLTFKSLATDYGWAALITNGSAHDSIINCFFDMTSVTSISSANTNGIAFSGSNTAATTAGSNGSNCYIGNNYVKFTDGTGGGYYAISLAGVNDSNVIENNTIENYYYYGAYVNGASNLILKNNNFHKQNKTASITTFYGIYTTGVTPGMQLIGNRIHHPGGALGGSGTFYGINSLGDGTLASPVLIANNAIYGVNLNGALNGIYLSTSPYNYVYHNSVVFDQALASTSTTYGIYATGTNTNTEVKNNNVSITAGTAGIKYGFYYSTAASVADVQKNNIYLNSTQAGVQNYGYYATAYLTQAAFQTAYPALELGSPSVDPLFVAAATGNLLPTNPAVLAAGENLLLTVQTDINNIPRSSSPTLGAFESLPTGINDAATQAMLNPESNVCAASVPFEVVIRNAGTNNLTSLQINWMLNGVLQTPYSYTNTLTPSTSSTGQNSDTVTLGSALLTNGVNNIKIWTSSPNNVVDPFNSNDTLTTTFTTSNFQISSNIDTMCVTGTALLTLTPSSGYGAGVIQWQSSTNGTTWTPLANSNATTYLVSGLATATQFRAQVSNYGVNCLSGKDTVNVIDPLVLTTTPAQRCGPGTLTLGATSPTGTLLKWYDALTGGIPLNTGSSFITPSIPSTTTYYVAAGTSANAADSIAIPLATGNTSGIYHHMFLVSTTAGMTINEIGLKVMATTGTTTSWDVYYRPDNYQLVAGANTSATGWILLSSNTSVTSLGPNEYTTISSNINLTIPTGATYSLYIAPNDAASTHQYYSPTIGTVTASNSTTNIIAGNRGSTLFNCSSAGGQAVVKLKSSAGCESARTPVVATINPSPLVNLGNDTLICPGGSVTLNASAATGTSYSWSTGASTPSITVSTAGTYIVTVGNNTSCTTKDTLIVGIAPVPTANLQDTVTICAGGQTTLNAGNAGANFSWNTGSTNQAITVQNQGNYVVNITNSNSCSSKDSTYLVVNPLPVVNLGNDTMVCTGSTITLNAQNPGATYLWSTGATTQTINTSVAGSYSVVVTNGFNCFGSDTVNVLAFTPVSVDGFNFVPRFDLQPGRVDFTPINPILVNNYHWNFGDGTTSTLQNPSHVYSTSANYLVTLSVANECGSKDTSLMIYVDLQLGVRFANSADIKIDVYPVPAQESLTIECLASEVKLNSVSIYNGIGQEVVLKQNISNSKTTINTDGLTTGNYFIKIETNKGTAFRRVNILK